MAQILLAHRGRTFVKRKEIRINKNLLIYNTKDHKIFGVTTNISKNGLFIETKNNYNKKFEELLFVVGTAEDNFLIKGEVRWKKVPDDGLAGKIPEGIGIRLLEAPAEYLNYFEFLKYNLH